jgi:hypothetical protein
MSADALANVAAQWVNQKSGHKKLVHFLSHQYTDEGLSWQALKGKDACAAQAILESDAYDAFLVSVKLTEERDEECDEVLGCNLQAHGWLPQFYLSVTSAFPQLR